MEPEGGFDKPPFPVLWSSSVEQLIKIVALVTTSYQLVSCLSQSTSRVLGIHEDIIRFSAKREGIIKDIARFILYCKMNYFYIILSIVSGPGMTPSFASHCWCLFYFAHLN